MTIHLTATADIDAPAEAVWAVVADYARDPEWRGGVQAMSSSPPGLVTVGARTDETMRFAGRTLRNLGVVLAVEPGRQLRWRTTDGADAHGSRTVEPMGADRCRLQLELVVEPRASERPLVPLLRRLLQRRLQADCRALGALVAAEGYGRRTAPSGRAA